MAVTGAIEVVMPQMGVSVSEGTITKWLKQEGDQVEADEALLEISTDKVDTEVPSPGSGVVSQILVQEGETVDVGTTLAVIGGEAGTPAAAPEPEAPESATPEAAAEPSAVSSAEADVEAAPPPAAEPTPSDGQQDGKSFVSPVVARIAAEHGVNVSSVTGTGRGGRVTKKDILKFIESGPPAAPPAPPKEEAPAPAPAPAPAAAPPAPVPAMAGAGEILEPMTAMRRGIAEHMRRSLDTSAHVTTVFEVDMSKVVAIRN